MRFPFPGNKSTVQYKIQCVQSANSIPVLSTIYFATLKCKIHIHIDFIVYHQMEKVVVSCSVKYEIGRCNQIIENNFQEIKMRQGNTGNPYYSAFLQ